MRGMQNQINTLKNDFQSSMSRQDNELKNELQNTNHKIEQSLSKIENMFDSLMGQTNHASTSGTLPGNTIPNPKGELKAITVRSSKAYDGPSTPIPPPMKEAEREPEVTKDKVQSPSSRSTAHVQPSVVQTSIPEFVFPKSIAKPSIPYPSRLNDQKLRDKTDIQMKKFLEIFQKLHFDISFADALLYMPKFASTFKNLISNKEKLLELAETPINAQCSAVLLKELPEKLGDS